MTPAQQAQQNNRTSDGRYAEGQLADPGTNIGLTVVECPRHGGVWGDDETCSHCCDSDGNPYPAGQAGEPNDDEDDLARMRQAEEARWGTVTVRDGARTPWGAAQTVSLPAAGIAVVGCAQHGGIKLSPERNREIPTALRNSSGWYEEDCEAHIVAWIHPEAFPNWMNGDLDAVREYGRAGVINWFPDKYEQATGETIGFGESTVKDEATWNAAHAGELCLYSSGAKEHPDYPGCVVVTTYRVGANDGHWTEHMMPAADYQAADAQRKFGAASVRPLLPASAVDVTIAEPAKPKLVPHTGIDTSKAANSYRAEGELDKRWRDETGRIFTMREDIEAGVFTGKHMFYDQVNGWRYSFERAEGGGRVTPVTRALYDAYTGPDSTVPSEVTYGKWLSKRKSVEKARDNWDQVKAARLQAEADQIRARYEAEHAAEQTAARPTREQTAADRAAAEKAALDAAYATLKKSGAVQ